MSHGPLEIHREQKGEGRGREGGKKGGRAGRGRAPRACVGISRKGGRAGGRRGGKARARPGSRALGDSGLWTWSRRIGWAPRKAWQAPLVRHDLTGALSQVPRAERTSRGKAWRGARTKGGR
ncbi:hypothetical protein Naga_102808g1, partial [Nannochloropsis gaditana]